MYGTVPNPLNTKIEKLIGRAIMKGLKVEPVGSRALKHYKAVNAQSDWDFLISPLGGRYDHNRFIRSLERNDFKPGGSLGTTTEDSDFISMKVTQGNKDVFSASAEYCVNFIVAKNQKFYDTFLAAQKMVEKGKVFDKADRIKVFDFMFDKPNKTTPDDIAKILSRAA